MASDTYRRPAASHRTTLEVANSRFITTISRVDTTEEVKQVLAGIREEMPDASHHVYAFRIGYGNSVIEGMSDDGEPSGTSGPPTLAVLRGTDIGDVIVITTRYFGGTKLGTGGLVRAYSEAARQALSTLKTEQKIPRVLLGMDVPYNVYENTKRLINRHGGQIQDEIFQADISLIVMFPQTAAEVFAHDLSELTAGRVQPILLAEYN